MIVVLRSELGCQLGLVYAERKKYRKENPELAGEEQLCARGGPLTKRIKQYQNIGYRARRLEIAINALGSLQLGDIE
jgi:hypothetical protein